MKIEDLFGVIKVVGREESGVDVEKLLAEIETLRRAAIRYARAVAEGSDASGPGLDLETVAIRYVRKLDDEHRKANEVDYLKIVEDAEREQAARERAKRGEEN